MTTPPATVPTAPQETRGLWLGLLGVTLFAATLPMTRLAVGPLEAPALSPAFVTGGRAAVAGLLSVMYLWLTQAPRPRPSDVGSIVWCALGTVLGFPLGLALALREVPASHGAVATGLLPLATAVVAAWGSGQRPSKGFWACAVLGFVLVIAFAAWRGGGALHAADGWLLLAISSAAVGYVHGAKLATRMRSEQVISWVLVYSLPFTLPWALWHAPRDPWSIGWVSWGGFTYVALVSMWIGFFAWYRALALGGTLRVSQVQLVQPFLSLLLAWPLAGEPLETLTLVFALAVMAVVVVGKRMSVGTVVAPASRAST
jgi:drug/metabolite transporter (DMT)-like permease